MIFQTMNNAVNGDSSNNNNLVTFGSSTNLGAPDLRLNREKSPAVLAYHTPSNNNNSAMAGYTKSLKSTVRSRPGFNGPLTPVMPLSLASSANPNASVSLSKMAVPSGTTDYFVPPNLGSLGRAPVSLGNAASQRHSSQFI